MTTTRLANLLIDTAGQLAEAADADTAWTRITAIAGRLQARSVNAGVFLRETQSIAWMRSSMAADWLDEYAGDALYGIDPLLKSAMAGAPPRCYDVAARGRLLWDDAGQRHLHGRMMDYRYRYMLTHCRARGPEITCLVLGCEDDPHDLFGPGTARAFSAVSAMLSHSVQPPAAGAPDGRAFGSDWQNLRPREVDVLSFLALGLTEDEIATRVGLATVEIRRLIAGASRKMGAATPDEALALAMIRGLLPL